MLVRSKDLHKFNFLLEIWYNRDIRREERDEEPIIQTMGTNVAINIAKEEGMNLIDVFTFPNLFSGMHDGVPSFSVENEDHTLTWFPVTEDMLTDELKEAVDLAFEQDFTKGAIRYYDNRKNYSKHPTPKEFIQEGDWIFFKNYYTVGQ